MAVEVSTAGLRKPVGEIYPARPYLEMLVDAGCPIALSSDAHTPEQLGFRYEQALELLDEVGVTRAGRVRAPAAAPGADRVSRTGIGIDSHAFDAGPPADPRRRRDPARGRPRRPLRRRRARPRDHRRAARRGRAGRHRPALPRHRRALARRRLDGAAARRRAREVGAVEHVDATVMMERPKLAPHRDAIRASAGGGARLHRSTSRRRPARGWASSAAARASRRWRWRRCVG